MEIRYTFFDTYPGLEEAINVNYGRYVVSLNLT